MKKLSGILLLSIAVVTFTGVSLTGIVGCGGGGSTPVTNPPTVSPSAVAVPIGGTQQFTATNFSGSVTWSVSPQVGSIDANGLYHAPASFPAPNNLTVTASGGGAAVNANALVVYPNDNAGAH
ncbi:MAG TPA: hypothetical protein VKL99_06665, partial [Candidatus Angelobacter sp.]|nr:hypothetical protein [Candidatus Angelobacter sp.]